MLINNRGSTLPEMLISGTIIGSLAVGSVPIYNNYVDIAKTAEAFSFMGTIRQYAEGYYRAHGHYPTKGNWADDFIGNQNTYFEYKYETLDNRPRITAIGKVKPFTSQDTLTYFLEEGIWEASGKLDYAKPKDLGKDN